MKWMLVLTLGVGLVLTGCQPELQPTPSPEPATTPPAESVTHRVAFHPKDSDAVIREKGRALVGEAFSVLSSNLMAALATGGPSNAIPFCSVQALPLTESVGTPHAATLRRVSQRVRNPANAPTPAEAEVLRAFEQRHAASEPLSPVIDRTENSVTFYAPIVINNPLCLTCHGEPHRDISANTLALLEELYPADQATGFKLNDLRGMWVVRVAAEPDAP